VFVNVSRPPLSPTLLPTLLDNDYNQKRPSPLLPPLDDDDATSPSKIVTVSPQHPSLPDVIANAAGSQQ